MTIPDRDYIVWSAQALQIFGRTLNVPLPPFPSEPVTPPNPIPPVSSDTVRTFDSGIKVSGATQLTSQLRRLKVAPGTVVSFNAPAKRGMVADNTDPWGANIPYHTATQPLTSPVTLASGQSIVIAKPRVPVGNDPLFLEEAVLVQAVDYTTYQLDPMWPTIIQGATSADVDQFLSETNWCQETREGWAARHGRPLDNCTPSDEPGYGAVIAERTSFGALLLCSTLTVDLKLKVQDRLVLLANDVREYGVPYPADGGHGNGRYILYLVARRLGIPMPARSDGDFSENQQLIAYTGSGNLAGIGWRHHITDPVNMLSDYVNCCTANRWAGAALVASLCPQLNANQMWIRYTKAYLASQFNNTTNAWYFCKHTRSAELIRNNRGVLGY